ncbi:hypothetical protein Q673_02710 [Marinobacter sp. EN3]|jgi:hypothetical protein|uniref:antiterminator Q family protein n=1 Tax=Marinobacter sp. EN3 TaxID=1397533 RepID=UPI0003B8798E|nr:antiterminator Q family protein [Marinobacter sp. EN3]ERS12542.1 hypothetical protein Q673_02710 [Marinobacter sp. EN3]
MLSDTQQRLTAWGHWVRAGGVDLGIKGVNLAVGSSVAMPICPDDDALAVDNAIARLKRRDPVMGRVLTLAYLNQFSLARIARESGEGSRERVRYLLGGAEAWIDAVLHGMQS